MSFLENLGRAVGFNAPAATVIPQPTNNNNGGVGNMQFGTPTVQPNPTGNAGDAQNQNNNNQQGNTNLPLPVKKVEPIDVFAKLGDNTNTDTPPAFTLDQAQLLSLANGQDFAKGVNPELLTKANSGDSAAMIELMQTIARNAYQTAIAHNSKLTETFVTAREGYSSKGLGAKVRGELTVNALTGTPNFDNPAVRRHLVSIAQSLERDHPDASPDQIATMAKDAVTQMASAINPNAGQNNQQGNRNAPKETNWDAWFDN